MTRRLVGFDGAFLAVESPTTHLHVTGVLVLDPETAGRPVGYTEIRDQIGRRLHRVPPLRSIVVEVPFGLQHPYMVEDPHFDLDFHVRRTGVPPPGDKAELEAVVAAIVERPLDRRRPLWEFHIIEGLAGGRLAMVSKIHHSIIDGVAGADVLAAFLDVSPEPAEVEQEVVPASERQVEGRPGDLSMVRDAIGSLPTMAERAVRAIGKTISTARELGGRNRQATGTLPPGLFDAPHTSINRSISPHRRVSFARVDLGDVKRVKTAFGGTVNDVILTAAAGGMRELFERRGEHLDSSLVAMVPVSIRTEDEHGEFGNRLSAMLVSLASGVADPVARLGLVSDGVEKAKQQHEVLGTDVIDGWVRTLLPAVATRASRLMSNLRLFDKVRPPFNLIVSNVPGPDFDLYLAGARLEALYPVGPLMEGVGVNITVFSYSGEVFFGVQGCWDLVPDVEVIARGIEGCLADLVAELDRRERPVPWWHGDVLVGAGRSGADGSEADEAGEPIVVVPPWIAVRAERRAARLRAAS